MPFDDDSRNLRNRPSFAPGMNDDDDDDDDDDFGSPMGGGLHGVSMRNQSFSSTPPSPFGGGGFSPQPPGGPRPFGGGGFGTPMQPQQPMGQQGQKTAEDMFWDGAKNVATGAKTFMGALQEAFSGKSYMSLAKSTVIMIKTSAVGAVIGAVGMVLGFFLSICANGLAVILGALLNIATGLIIYPFLYNRGRDEVLQEDNAPITPEPVFAQQAPSFDDEDADWSDEAQDDEFQDDWESDDDDDAPTFEEEEEPEEPISEPVNPLDAIRQLPDYEPHTQTRSCLYDHYMRVLPFMHPNFQQAKKVDDSSQLWDDIQKQIITECQKMGIDEDDIPTIDSIVENGFMYTIRFSTTVKTLLSPANRDEVANQIALQLMVDMTTGMQKRGYEGFTGRSNVIGTNVFLYIFKGSKSETLVSLADASRVSKDEILNPSIMMPVICGVGEQGQIHMTDYSTVESQIITGQPRSGKSWQAQSIVAQMCMYSSPRDLIFEVFDVKGTSSDFYLMAPWLPHFRVFRSDPKAIVERMKYLVEEEARRRSEILARYKDEGVINIKDLHKSHPEVDMPYLYIIIDEMKTLSGRLETIANTEKDYKNIYKEYKAYLGEIATKTPNLGIRGIYVAHRLVENIIPKTVHEMIGSKMLVRAPKDDIEAQLAKREQFTYKLVQPGDMAMKDIGMTRGAVVYNHGLGITMDNNGNQNFYRYIGEVWRKFEPEFHIHTDQVSVDALLYNRAPNLDYRKDPLGMGGPQRQPQQQPRQTMQTNSLFSHQMENGFEEKDDDAYFAFDE